MQMVKTVLDGHRCLSARRHFEKRLHLHASLYTILQILSLTLCEKMPISQAIAQLPPTSPSPDNENHLCLLVF